MYFDLFDTELGELLLATQGDALCLLDYQAGTHARQVQPDWLRAPQRFAAVKAEVTAYLAGELMDFSIAVAPQGTLFQQQVWQALQTIPYGHTASYADIAERIGRPQAVRAVGAANGANPISLIIPCHRVIGKNGSLTGYAGGLDVKQRLLALEQPAVAMGQASLI